MYCTGSILGGSSGGIMDKVKSKIQKVKELLSRDSLFLANESYKLYETVETSPEHNRRFPWIAALLPSLVSGVASVMGSVGNLLVDAKNLFS